MVKQERRDALGERQGEDPRAFDKTSRKEHAKGRDPAEARKGPKKTAGSGRRLAPRTKRTSTFVTVEQIVRADFYTAGRARNTAYAMVYMTDGNQYRVDGEQAFALETLLTQAQISLTPP